MKILYAASEATPFAKSGGLADVAGSLPKALVKDGVDARVSATSAGELAGTTQRALEGTPQLSGYGPLFRLLSKTAESLASIAEANHKRGLGRGIPDHRCLARYIFALIGTHEHILRFRIKRALAKSQGP